jgi:hypothetical protein
MTAEHESTAARVVGALLDGGEAIDEGRFSLDPDAAALAVTGGRPAPSSNRPNQPLRNHATNSTWAVCGSVS